MNFSLLEKVFFVLNIMSVKAAATPGIRTPPVHAMSVDHRRAHSGRYSECILTESNVLLSAYGELRSPTFQMVSFIVINAEYFSMSG
jgi:hypothetical protein